MIVRPGDVRNLNSRGEVVKSRRESGSNGAFGNGNGMSRDGDGSGGGSGSDDYWNRGGVGTTSIVPHIHNNSSSSGSDDVSKENDEECRLISNTIHPPILQWLRPQPLPSPLVVVVVVVVITHPGIHREWYQIYL